MTDKKDDPIWNEFFPQVDDKNSNRFTDDDEPTSQTDMAELAPAIPPDQLTPLICDHPLSEAIVEALKTIYDPELPVNIYDLGLIYRVDIDETNHVNLVMTLTTPGCPVAQTFPDMIAQTLEAVDGVNSIHVDIVWDPPWSQERMSEEAKLLLGLL